MDASPDSRAQEIAALGPWFHNLHLPGGLETAPDHRFGDFPAWKWQQIEPHLPRDLTGWRALDIGCNAGFYSFKLAGRGARVVAIDHDEHYLRQARWAAAQLDPHRRVRFEQREVYGMARCGERFDLILFLGVLYHLRYPLFALDTLYRLRPRLLVVQTLTLGSEEIAPNAREPFDFDQRGRMEAPGWPRMAFIENSFADDPTNWWVPNRACVLAMLRSAGFRVDAEPGHEIFLCSSDGEAPFGSEQWDAIADTFRSGDS